MWGGGGVGGFRRTSQLYLCPSTFFLFSFHRTSPKQRNSLCCPTESQTLHSLLLYSNNLTSLSENIVNLDILEGLNVSNNQLTILPESIGDLSILVYLNLNSNQFTIFPESITNLSNLEWLSLSTNQLTTLPGNFCNINSNMIDVSYNYLCEEYHYECIVVWDGQICENESCESGYSSDDLCLNQDNINVLIDFINLIKPTKGIMLYPSLVL